MRLKHPKRVLLHAAVLALLAVTQWQCFFVPDDRERGERVPNERPSVRITGGVMRSDSSGVDYRVDFRWHGWDDDGVVNFFEWAVDDTTLERAWRRTEDFGGQIEFQATRPSGDGEIFFDWHRFFIRSVDNEFARSPIDARLFNARTIAPETRITFPLVYSGHIRRPRTFFVTWEGEDLDATNAEKQPSFYEYKLVEIRYGDDSIDALLNGNNVFFDTLSVGDHTAWVRVPAEVTSLRLTELAVPNLYVFGLRAIDEAGAVEQSLDAGENYFVFEVTDQDCRPTVTLSESRIGTFVFPTNGPSWTVEVPAEAPLRFRWTGDASHCGSRVGNVNYGFDMEDPSDESLRSPDGVGGWIGWGQWPEMQHPISFPSRDHGRIHNFYLKMRDDTNDPRSETFCWVQIRVIAFPMNSPVLIVDDATPAAALAGFDADHDAFRDRVLACAWDLLGDGEAMPFFDVYNRHDSSQHPAELPLSTVAQYRLIIWNSIMQGRSQSGLARNEVERRILTHYVGAGGRLFLYGSMPVSGLADDDYTMRSGDGICPDLPGAENPAWSEESFIWKFLHVRNCVRGSNSGVAQQLDGWVGATAVHPLYPDIAIDREVWDPWEVLDDGRLRGGMTFFQVYRRGRGVESRPDPGLDTIYVARTANFGGSVSTLSGQPISLRYEATAEDSALSLHQGRVFLQMFPYYFTDEIVARENACKALSWITTGRDE